MNVTGQLHAPAALQHRKKFLGTYCVEGWVGPTAVLESGGGVNLLFPKIIEHDSSVVLPVV
jgi:hypothetical protein